MPRIRVALADDHPVVLAGVKALIQAAPEMELVGEATDGSAALKLIQETTPDVVVMDISMPGLTGLELVQRVGAGGQTGGPPGAGPVKALVLTVHEDRAYVQKVLGAGARGYLLKRSAAEELVRAIRAVHAGGLYVDPAIAGKFVQTEAGETAAGDGLALSEREEEVLKLAAQGHTNKEAAARLGLSIKTVESYKARAMEKLGLKTRAEIVRYGLARDWLGEG
jgi:DNA-binding NarL/FixJ family response regulator